jgi:4-hydroxy-4-methyl-2-oxoglutarate aldolase
MMDLQWLATTLASDATDGEGVLPTWCRPLDRSHRIVGRATTVTMGRDDSSAFREAMERGPSLPGANVLVAGGGSTSRRACMGGILARKLLLEGYVALITDGLVRDAADIRGTGFQVWCRGQCPIASQQRGGGQIGPAVLLGDVLVRDGDWVIADEDGVVVWPQERHDELLDAARKRLASDQERESSFDAQLRAQSNSL